MSADAGEGVGDAALVFDEANVFDGLARGSCFHRTLPDL
jgi:hypothetical protein